MAPPLVHELSALRHSWPYTLPPDHPRPFLLLVVFLCGLICLGASHVSKWLPGVDGRFTPSPRDGRTGLLASLESHNLLKQPSSPPPARPRRYSVPILVACIIVRLELFSHVSYQQQCSKQGVESWLCLLLIVHDITATRRKWSKPVTDEMEDPWRSVFDDIHDWLSGPRAAVTLFTTGALLFSTGTYVAANQIVKSTYICFVPLDSRSQTILLQYAGLLLDAVIIVLLWRVLTWTRSLNLRLRMLSNIFLTSSLFISFLWLSTSLLNGSNLTSLGFGLLRGFDVLADGLALATMTIGLSIWTCETTPVVSTAVTTLLYGIWRATMNVFSLGDWMHLSRSASLGPLWLITFGSGFFIYAHDIRSVIFIRRTLFVSFMVLLLITATCFTFIYPLEYFDTRHPINELMYEARTIHDRWLVKASTSTTLATAVIIYGERHGGRSPPPHFGDWYQYASGSSIIDEFQQIDGDLEVFWSLPPATLRRRVQSALSHSGVHNITVENGQVTVGNAGQESTNMDLKELADMIKKFSRHLPDMVLPINLDQAPRVLPLWKDAQLQSRGYLHSMAKIISRRSANPSSAANNTLGSRHAEQTAHSARWHQTRAGDLRQMQAEACPVMSNAHTSPFWDPGLFCSACVKQHSRGQLLSDWGKSLDVCSQPDLYHLHSFVMTDQSSPPIRELVPLFGPSKMTGFQDILVPLPHSRQDHMDGKEPFLKRKDTLFWRTAVGGQVINEQALRGSHKLRLLHLINKADAKDRVTVILPIPGEENKFRSVSVSVPEANHDLSFDVGIDDFSACTGQYCNTIKEIYGEVTQTEDPLKYRYVLLTDEDDGPPDTTLKMLRSQSLPFISTVFKTWYSERLTPWLHFVPVDPRYQALHTTLLYYTGTANKAKMNGINTYLKGRSSDGEWIAQQGARWAGEAISKKDMEIYLFRLLLEWGRLIDDRRDEIGYKRESNERVAAKLLNLQQGL